MKRFKIDSLINNPRLITVFCLSISSGLPLALTGSTLQAWYTVAGVNLMTIGLLTLVGQPYAYKFLWAPVIDRFIPIKHLGRRRSWIVLMQSSLVLGLTIMAFLNPQHHANALALIAVCVACCSASQDIAIDAYRTDILPIGERGLGASLGNFGYRIAMILSGAFSLILAAEIGWRYTYLIMATLMLLGLCSTLKSPRPLGFAGIPSTFHEAIIEPFRDFMGRHNAIALIAFIVLYKISDALALSLNTTFLIRGLGFSLLSVGSITKTVGLISALLGSFVGGILLLQIGLYRSLMLFGILQAVSNLSFTVLAWIGKHYLAMTTAIFLDYFCGSLSSIALIVFFMHLCNQRYTATQYALFSALSAIGRTFGGPIAVNIVKQTGWAEFYFWSSLIGCIPLLLLYWLKHRIDFSRPLPTALEAKKSQT